MTTEYIAAPGCIFVPAVEFSIIESAADPKVRAEWGDKGMPRTTLEDGYSYTYIPVIINGVAYRLISGDRPVVSLDP